MTVSLFKQLANVTGLQPILSICVLVLLFSLTLFGALILIKIRSIKRALNKLNMRLDRMSQRLGWQSGDYEDIQPFKFKLGSYLGNEITAGARSRIDANNSVDITPQNDSEENRKNTKIYKKI